jgi:hypothetical protein
MYDNNDNNNSTASNRFAMQKRVYMVSINKKDGTKKPVGYINIEPSFVKDAGLFGKIEQELDKALASGLVKFGGTFSIEASDKGANSVTEEDFAW